jgi:hypothetical protein
MRSHSPVIFSSSFEASIFVFRRRKSELRCPAATDAPMAEPYPCHAVAIAVSTVDGRPFRRRATPPNREACPGTQSAHVIAPRAGGPPRRREHRMQLPIVANILSGADSLRRSSPRTQRATTVGAAWLLLRNYKQSILVASCERASTGASVTATRDSRNVRRFIGMFES